MSASFRRVKLSAALLCLFAVLFSGCSQFAPTPEPVTLTFMHPQDRSGSYEAWAQQFNERYPHITIELEAMSAANASRIAAKDTFISTQFDMAMHAQNRVILDLSTFIEQDGELNVGDFYAPALDTFNDQGRQWALPFGIDMLVLYYNKDIFDRYMVSYPWIGWSWGDFLELALQTTDPGANLHGYALHYDTDFAAFEPVVMIYQHGGHIFDSLQAPTRVTLDDPRNIDAMEFYASLIHDHRVAPSPEDVRLMGRPYPWRGVFEGRFAMWAGMFSDRGGVHWPTPWRMEWGVVPMPHGQAAATLATAEGLFISAQCEHPDAAWLWIKFLSEQTPPYLMPARQSLAQSTAFEARVGSDVAASSRAALQSAMLVNPSLMGFEQGLNAMWEAFAQIRTGELPAEIALTRAQERSGH